MSGRSRAGGRSAAEGDETPEPDVYEITSASASLSDDQSSRIRVYVIQMTVRMICFGLAIFTDGWLRWVFFIAAMVLPYFAVVFANNTRVVAGEPLSEVLSTTPALTTGKTELEASETTEPVDVEDPDVVEGNLVDDDMKDEKRSTQDGKNADG